MPDNISINDGNFSFGPLTGFFYTINKSVDALFQVEADGDVVDTFPITLSQLRNPVIELHYDGTFFWTLEELPSDLGIVIKKWRLFPHKTNLFPTASPSELRWQDELTLLNQPNTVYESRAFAIEHYHRQLVGSTTQGSSSIQLNDISEIALGDELYLGPSTFAGSEGQEESLIVGGLNQLNNTVLFLKQGGLASNYNNSDPVSVTKKIWVFNDHSFSGRGEDDEGSLSSFEYPSKSPLTTTTGRKYNAVVAADFDQTRLSFIRGPMLLTVNLGAPVWAIESSITINLMAADRANLIEAFDLISDLDNNLYYKLQQKETTEDIPTGTYTTINRAPDYNFQTETNLSFIKSIALNFSPTRFAISLSSPKSRKFTVTAEVRDQYNFPVLGKDIQFTTTVNNAGAAGIPGTMDPAISGTDILGRASSEFTPSVTAIDLLMDVKAQVLP